MSGCSARHCQHGEHRGEPHIFFKNLHPGFYLVLRSSLWQYCSKRRLWGRQAVISSLKQKGWNYGKWMITWYKQKFLEIGLVKITSYQASLPGSVEVVRVMYGALATQVFFCWEYCRLSVIFELQSWVTYLDNLFQTGDHNWYLPGEYSFVGDHRTERWNGPAQFLDVNEVLVSQLSSSSWSRPPPSSWSWPSSSSWSWPSPSSWSWSGECSGLPGCDVQLLRSRGGGRGRFPIKTTLHPAVVTQFMSSRSQ